MYNKYYETEKQQMNYLKVFEMFDEKSFSIGKFFYIPTIFFDNFFFVKKFF